MSDYERFALVLDSASAELGRAALRLLELGIDVLYANDLDEAELLARQESERLGAVLIPATSGLDRVEALLSRVCSQLAAGARGLVLVGLEPEPEFVEVLRAKGVTWRLWEPFEERELRFVMTAAMATEHGGERRKNPRIPSEIATTVFMGRHRKDVTVHDLSATGAYLAATNPFLEGSRLSFEIPLPDGLVAGKAEVTNAKTADRPGRADLPEGMGIAFTQLTPGSRETLEAFLQGWIQRFRL
jgi:hypothetical protein